MPTMFWPNVAALVLSLGFSLGLAYGQIDSRGSTANLVIEGTVEAVYLSTTISDSVYMIQLKVAKGSLPNVGHGGGLPVPMTGKTAYVIYAPVGQRQPNLPAIGEQIRANVATMVDGKVQAVGRDWFQLLPTRSSQTKSDTTNDPSLFVDVRGMTCEAKILSGQLAFEVKSVDEAGPARDAGFQIGDIITEVSGSPLASVATLKELVAKSQPLELTVVDINTGRLAKVELASAPISRETPADKQPPSTDKAARDSTNATARITAALDIEIIPTRIGVRKSAVTVSKVSPSSAGAEAGLEVGDVILAVDDQAVGSVEDFAAALPAAGGKATLLVRDSRTGNDVPVEVVCKKSGAAGVPQITAPSRPSAPPVGPADHLGLVTELTFFKAEAAVKVVDVRPGSAASRAKIQPGSIILTVDETPVLHPDQLEKAVDASRGIVRLTVVDPRSGRETQINLQR